MTLKYLLEFCRKLANKHPDIREEIMDIYIAAKEEVEDGSGEAHEVELAIDYLNEMVEEINNA